MYFKGVNEQRNWQGERTLRAVNLLHGLQAPACDLEPYLTLTTLCPLFSGNVLCCRWKEAKDAMIALVLKSHCRLP